ncbi:hypothetical protein FB558_3021 [Pseudonocardia kunmingensis]|uniref:Uncharacterized protein n=1 Tax=Pseudonocardia kunmingensis TaxID=630975 RepID=A0A543E3U1_9PSEU|nr:hypothetical protein FB558_3021 [Pseudonocardia kunmingensis]
MGLRRRRSTSGRSDGATDGASDVTAGVAAVTSTAGRAARTAGAATENAGAELAARARKPLTAARAKRMIGVGKAVAPLLAPYALAAAGVARARWDAYRAARLGVEPGQLATYAGPGGALHARLSRLAQALDELESGSESDTTNAARSFAAETRPRLADLAVAVRAAEQMPTTRRRTAYRAIGGELDRLEVALLRHLGIAT